MSKKNKGKGLIPRLKDLVVGEEQLPDKSDGTSFDPIEPYHADPGAFAIKNRISAGRTRAATDLNEATSEYIRSGIELEKAVTEGYNMDSILKAHELEIKKDLDKAQVERDEARRDAKNRAKDDEINELKKKVKIAELEAQLDKLKNSDSASELSEYDKKQKEKLDRENIDKKYQRERYRSAVNDAFERKRLLDEEEAEKVAELLKRFESGKISVEVFDRELKNTRDFYKQQRAKN